MISSVRGADVRATRCCARGICGSRPTVRHMAHKVRAPLLFSLYDSGKPVDTAGKRVVACAASTSTRRDLRNRSSRWSSSCTQHVPACRRDDDATVAVRRSARPALPRRRAPAGADDRVEGGLRTAHVPSRQGAPRAVGDAASRRRARRPVRVRARRPPTATRCVRPCRCAIRRRGRPSDSSNPSTASRCCPPAGSPRRVQTSTRGPSSRGGKRLLLEDFYRDARRRHDVLMDGAEPAGGRWNFDADNREPPPKTDTLGVRRTVVARRGRDRRRGAPRPRRVGTRRRRRVHRHGRPAPVRRDPRRGVARAARLHRSPAAVLRRARGRHAARRRLDGALAAVRAAQPRPARSDRGRPARRIRLPRRRCADRVRRGIRAPDPRLARLRLASVLARGR